MVETNNKNSKKYKNWFFFTLVYLLIDYGRPQDILPIGFLKPGMIVILILTGFILFTGKLKESDSKQTRLIWLFILLLGIYVPFAVNNFLAYKTTETIFLLMPFILSIVICVNSIEHLKKMIFFLILLMIYVSGYSLLHGGVGSGNYFKDENDLSLYINMYLPFCFFFSLSRREESKRLFMQSAWLQGLERLLSPFHGADSSA